jgi:hypothetical protein
MNITQIKYVLEIASSSSMREAATKLFVSQPALSASVAELEEELGILIFERTNKGISLTDEEADKLTDSLITNGFGNIVTLAREYKHRKETYYSNISDEELENGTC